MSEMSNYSAFDIDESKMMSELFVSNDDILTILPAPQLPILPTYYSPQLPALPPLPQCSQFDINNNNNSKQHIMPTSSYNSLASLGSIKTNKTIESDTSSSIYDEFIGFTPPMLSNNNGYNTCCCNTKIRKFYVENGIKLQLKNYIFISKDCTRRLAQYIVSENWGYEYGLLYKYLDYIFRCQTFDNRVICIDNKYLIFNTGLQRKYDNELLFALLIRNKKSVQQKWRVQFGNIRYSFVSRKELLLKTASCASCVSNYIPKKTNFINNLNDLIFDNSYYIDINWDERLNTNRDRILNTLGSNSIPLGTSTASKHSLINIFNTALLKTQKILLLNPRLAVPQGFIDTKNGKYRMELLLPLNIEYPINSNNYYLFALALSKSNENDNKYFAKSILTIDMAYANARLVGYVDSLWLVNGYNKNNKKYTKNNGWKGY